MKKVNVRNLKITSSWNGQNFSGYQVQAHDNTIEGILTESWHTLTREKVKLTGCSRLDAGVHAEHFVFNVKTTHHILTEDVIKSLNGILHQNGSFDICISNCEEVEQSFNSRFSSTGKHYRYLIWHGKGEHAMYRKRSWHVKLKENLKNIENILKIFEGTHNFNSFRARDCGSKNSIKTIHKISVSQDKKYPQLYIIDILGDGFLKNMIRILIGAGILVIKGQLSKEDLESRLKTGENGYNLCAPAHALTLMQVYYLPIQNVENIFL